MLKAFWILYITLAAAKAAFGGLSLVLSAYTAPSDIRDMLLSVRQMNGTAGWIDIAFIGVGIAGLSLTAMGNNWRLAYARVAQRKTLRDLSEESRKLSLEISSLISDDHRRLLRDTDQSFRDRTYWISEQSHGEARFVSLLMPQVASVVGRAARYGYSTRNMEWDFLVMAGSPKQLMQEASKELYLLADLIREDADKGFLDAILSPAQARSRSTSTFL